MHPDANRYKLSVRVYSVLLIFSNTSVLAGNGSPIRLLAFDNILEKNIIDGNTIIIFTVVNVLFIISLLLVYQSATDLQQIYSISSIHLIHT